MDRRSFPATSATVALLPLTEAPVIAAVTAQAGSGDAKLNALFDQIFKRQVTDSPGFATSLGLDTGPNAKLRSTFDMRPPNQSRVENDARDRAALAAVRAIDPATLSQTAALNREIVIYDLETSLLSFEKFKIDSVQSPYLISQQSGNYFSLPDFLNSTHPIENASDAEAYISRLSQVGPLLDMETQDQKEMAARGFLAPGWSLDLALGQMEALRQPTARESTLVRSIAERTKAKGISGDWAARAAKIVETG